MEELGVVQFISPVLLGTLVAKQVFDMLFHKGPKAAEDAEATLAEVKAARVILDAKTEAFDLLVDNMWASLKLVESLHKMHDVHDEFGVPKWYTTMQTPVLKDIKSLMEQLLASSNAQLAESKTAALAITQAQAGIADVKTILRENASD